MEVLTYQCPNCGAPLAFNSETQKWDCKFCLSSFDKETLEAFRKQAEKEAGSSKAGQSAGRAAQSATEPGAEKTIAYSCPNCGAQIVTDQTTAASFCMFCGSPTVFPKQLSEQFRPDALIPFKLKKEDAVAALERLCKKKPLLPRDFRTHSHIEKVTGVYVPFWLFDCDCDAELRATAERIFTWSDSKYRYTKTDVYQVHRAGKMAFEKIPADGSSKMENSMMDALEPFDYQELQPFSLAFLSGFFAEKYDEDQDAAYPRIKERAQRTAKDVLNNTVNDYASVQTTNFYADISPRQIQNTMLPVWLLLTKFRGTDYMFAMNGQTGKMVGKLPISFARAAALFAGIFGAVFALVFLGGMLL